MKKKNLLASIAIGAGTLVTSAAIGYYALSEHLYNKMVRRQRWNDDGEEEAIGDENYLMYDLEEELISWEESVESEHVYITAFDQLELAGECYHPEKESSRWVIISRGNDLNPFALRNVAMEFHAKGYHVLIADNRGYGGSEGRYLAFGWHDRLDLMAWIDYVVSQDENAQIVLYGISMSAAGVMMAAGEQLEEHVRCIIEDSGFTSAYEFLSGIIKADYGIRAPFILEGVDSLTRVRARFSLKSASAVKQLRKSTLPILFIHGEEDEYIPLEHVFRLYHAAAGEKELYTVPYAEHGEAMFAPRYFERIMMFCDRYVD